MNPSAAMTDESNILNAKIGALKQIPLPNTVLAEYVWIGGTGELRSKSRVLSKAPKSIEDLPKWNYDGSSTNQAPGEDSEVIMHPCAIFKDPFRGGQHILVLCDTYTPQGVPIPTNKRAPAKYIFDQGLEHVPWFGIEQEYTLFRGNTPLGWPQGGFPHSQGPYYCSAGAENAYGRDIAEAHMRACIHAGIKVSGINAEVMPGQWEYQVGPCIGIESGDHLIMSRYIMQRVGEMAGVIVSFDPKPIPGDWNGAGCHTNFSTKATRADGGWDHLESMLGELEKRHDEHIKLYGEGNERRLTGRHETASMEKFSWGVANRGASVRIGRETHAQKKGYMEDRRPSSNMDPYVVTSKIFDTTVLKNPKYAK